MRIRFSTAATVAATVIGVGCGRGQNGTRDSVAAADSAAHASASNGAVAPTSDTTNGAISATTPALGPGIQVTSTDEHNVNRSLDYKLTDNDWSRFLKAADTVAALVARDAEVRTYLSSQIVGAKTDDAGEKWLEANPKVSGAIASAGITVKDYYRLGLVTAEAVRFMNDPSAAPPTPAGRANAEFVRGHKADVEHLRSMTP